MLVNVLPLLPPISLSPPLPPSSLLTPRRPRQWADALRGKETAETELKMTRSALDEANHHLAESAVWHNARVQGRRTTRALLSLPPETQDLAFAQQGLVDHDAVMVSEFLINNLMVVTCDLSNNDIGAEGATALAQGLVNNRVLTSLNLKDNVVGPEGCKKLALMLAGNRVMEKLNLMGCDVGDEGCIALSEVLCMPQCSIQLLALRFNGISDVGAQAMSRALETNSSLTELGLNSNHITDEGIAALTVRPASEHGCIALSTRTTQCIPAGFACHAASSFVAQASWF